MTVRIEVKTGGSRGRQREAQTMDRGEGKSEVVGGGR